MYLSSSSFGGVTINIIASSFTLEAISGSMEIDAFEEMQASLDELYCH